MGCALQSRKTRRSISIMEGYGARLLTGRFGARNPRGGGSLCVPSYWGCRRSVCLTVNSWNRHSRPAKAWTGVCIPMTDPDLSDPAIEPTRETYDRFQEAYAYFNRALFESKLPNCLITL